MTLPLRRSRSRGAIGLPLCLATLLWTALVHGGDPPPKPSGAAQAGPAAPATALPITGPNAQVSATAEALFEMGRDLMKEKKYAEACPKLNESLRIDPAIGTMLYLADCYEKNGQTASAWAMFSDAVAAAHNAGQGEREVKAKLRVQKLAPKLVKLTISLAPENKGVEDLELKRDGVVIGAALFGAAVPVDPGSHTIEVSAPGKKAWSGVATVPSKAGSSVAFVVPKLEDLPPPPPPPEPTVTATAAVTAPPPPPPTATATATVTAPPPLPPVDTTPRTVGLAVGAVGLAGVGVASALGLLAKSKNDEAVSKYCPGGGRYCTDQRGVDLTNEAKGLAVGSTVAFVISGVAVATGAVLILYPSLAKPAAPATSGKVTARVIAGPGSLAISGQF